MSDELDPITLLDELLRLAHGLALDLGMAEVVIGLDHAREQLIGHESKPTSHVK